MLFVERKELDVHRARALVDGRPDQLTYLLEWWGAGVVICLERRADLHTAQLMPLPLTVSDLLSAVL